MEGCGCQQKMTIPRCTPLAPCATQPFFGGETVISILRNVERLGSDNLIHTADSVVLASLCATCGRQLPEAAIRVEFVDEKDQELL